ncbi:MAG TPA: FTR1 family protein [Gemmatimonadaceae bacterium]
MERLLTAVQRLGGVLLWVGALALAGILVWQGLSAAGAPDPLAPHTAWGAATLDIGILVFREGLECVLVLAAITASMVGDASGYRRPIAVGVGLAALATLVTWRVAVTIIDSLTESFPALQVQAATGLLAIIVLLVVMNWFFHKVYWTGWIAAHTKKKRQLLKGADSQDAADAARDRAKSTRRVFWGLAALGFTSFYREGFEVVLFLQNYRLKLGGPPVLYGVGVGVLLAGIVAVLTLVAHQRLPHKKMLVLTGVLLGGVLLIMVGEQAQEMQLAHWLPTTPVASLERVIRPWMGLWFAIFPTVETLAAQALAAALVLGSYAVVQGRMRRLSTEGTPA